MKVAQHKLKSTKSAVEKRKAASKKRKERAKKARKRRKKYLHEFRKNNPTKRVILLDLCKAMRHHFPDLLDRLSQVSDVRKRKKYSTEELLMAGILLFVFKESSRNSMNNNRKEAKFAENYVSAFGLRLPHMDTVDTFLRQLAASELETLKTYLVKQLLKRRVLHKFRFFKKYFAISVDATGLGSYDQEPYEGCTFRVYKPKKSKEEQQGQISIGIKGAKDDTELSKAPNKKPCVLPSVPIKKVEAEVEVEAEAAKDKKGKKVWFQPVLEAKLVCLNGFSISIATEWILNEGQWDKQDCESKAFKRLANQLKVDFPRLSICIVADALYPNKSVFEICKQKGWLCILTLKDGQLKNIWQQVALFDQEYSINKT